MPRCRDYERLGLLLANEGAAEGRHAMTTADAPHLRFGAASQFRGYGYYQAWLIDPREPYDLFYGTLSALQSQNK